MGKPWAKWDNIHEEPEQKKRFNSANKGECTPISIDINHQTGVFSGSHGVYQTSLENCSCIDFSRRKKPCKHMYRLAVELGIWGNKQDTENDTFSRRIPRSELRQLTIDLVGRIENCAEISQTELKFILLEFLYRKHNEPFYYEDGTIIIPLIEAKILEGSPCYSYFIKKMTKKDMLSAIQSQGDELPVECKLKSDVTMWMISHADKYGTLLFQNCMMVRPSQELLRVAPSIYKYLHRKFDEDARMERYYDPDVGKMICVKKELPDDFETGLLHMFDTYPVD